MQKVPEQLERAINTVFTRFPWVMEMGIGRKYEVSEKIVTPNDAGEMTPTMATDGSKIFLHPGVLNKWTIMQIAGVVVHEWLHCELLHPMRAKQHPLMVLNHSIANQAMDIKVNPILLEWGLELPEGGGSANARKVYEKYKDMSFEEVFMDLTKNAKRIPMPGGGSGDGRADLDDPSWKEQPGDSAEEKKAKKAAGTANGIGSFDKVMTPPQDGDPDNRYTDPDEAMARLKRAVLGAKEAGKGSGDLEKLVDQWGKPKLDWRAILQRFACETCKSGWSWNHPRQGPLYHHNMITPSRRGKTTGRVVIIRDTSGSLYSEQQRLADEVRGVLSVGKPTMTTIIDIDTAVHQVLDIGPDDDIPPAKGGGGTDFASLDPVLQGLEPRPVCICILTDTYTCSWFENPGVPVLVLVIDGPENPAGVPDWAEVIPVPKDEI